MQKLEKKRSSNRFLYMFIKQLNKSTFKMKFRINHLFYRCGIFCASHPIPVIAIDMVIIVVLCSGLSLLRITTDPIELWAAPNSRYDT